MTKKPTYEELEERIRELEAIALDYQRVRGSLKDSEERYRMLAEFTYDWETWRGADGKYLYVSPSCERITGYTPDEFLQDPWLIEKIAHPEDKNLITRHFRRQFGERALSHVDFRIVTREGEEKWISHYCQPVYGRDGTWLGRRCSNRDFTERKRAEEDLRESEAHYRAIVEAFDGFIYICSKDYRIEYMNPSFIERTGYDATGRLCYEALHDRDAVCPWCVNEKVFKGETVRWEVLSPKDNRWLYTVNTPIYHIDGRISKQAMILDITERRRTDEALRKSTERIKLFSYSISHDLKNPAIGIYGLTKRLYKNYSNVLDEKGKDYCEQILKAARHISELVAQINAYISGSEAPPVIETVLLGDIVQMIRQEFHGELSLRRINWLETENLPEINADRLALLRVLRNLVDNALKYGGAALSEIRINYKDAEGFHILSVTDDGAMIREEDFERILRPFYRYRTARGVEGSGLGLAIVKQLTEQHGGKFWLSCDGTKRKTFHVSISKSISTEKDPPSGDDRD